VKLRVAASLVSERSYKLAWFGARQTLTATPQCIDCIYSVVTAVRIYRVMIFLKAVFSQAVIVVDDR